MNPDLWPARLHHLRRDSPQPERLARFYGELLGDRVAPLRDGSWLVAGRPHEQRTLNLWGSAWMRS